MTDARTGVDCCFCPEHKPDLWPGKNPHLAVRRWRMAAGNRLSQALAAPRDSREHKDLHWDLCKAGMRGGEGACRYYLSMITGVDQFVLWDDEFVSNIREFIVSKTCPAAARFCQNLHSIQFLAGFLRRAWEAAEGGAKERRTTRTERAVQLLLQHPEWSDERIAEQVPTTLKQLRRFADYAGLWALAQQQAEP